MDDLTDRKELLEKQFEEVDETPARDEVGRFKAKEAEPEPEPVKTEPEPVWKRPPASWKKDYHEVWATADDRMKEYAWQREEQMKRGVEPLLSKAQIADSFNSAIEPYMATIRGMGLEPVDAVKALMQADHTLRTATPDQKVAYFHQLAQQYGINLGGAQPQPIDPMLHSLQNELQSVRGEVLTWKQQQEAAQNEALRNEIEGFAAKAEHFEDAKPTMIQLLQSGMAENLQDAYDKAVRLNPDLFNMVQQAQQAKMLAQKSAELNKAAKTAKAAAVSVRGTTPGSNTAPKAQDRRSMLAEQFDSMTDRL